MSHQRSLLLLCIGALATGCQHVPRAQLDVAGHMEAWRARELSIEPIASIANHLAAQGVYPPAAFDPEDGLDLVEAEAVALWYNPRLRVARAEAGVSQARAETAGLLPDPELSTEIGRKREEEASGFLQDAAEVTRSWVASGSFSITLPLSGRFAAEKAWRAAQHDAALLGVAVDEWELLNDFHVAWLEWSGQVHRVKLLEEHLALVLQFSDAAEKLGAAGEIDVGSAQLFAVERVREEASLDEARHLAESLRLALLAMCGLAPEAPYVFNPSLALHQEAATETPSVSDQHPRLAQLKAGYEAAEDRLRMEVRAQYPDLSIGPAISAEKDESVIALGLGLPLPVWNLNRAGIAEAAAERDAARTRVLAAYEETTAELAQRQAALAAASVKRARLESEVAPLADRQIAQAQALVAIGELDFGLLYSVLAQTLEIKLELLEAVVAEIA